MKCRSIQELLHTAFERALTPEEQMSVDTHVAGCKTCRMDAALLRMVVEAIATAPVIQPSAQFTVNVLDRLPTPVRALGFLPVAAFRVAAGLIAVAGAVAGWLYRDALLELSPQAAITTPQGSALHLMYAKLNTLGYRMLDYIPVQQLSSPEWSPVTSVLIAIAVAMVILHMVNAFESLDDDVEWDLEPVAD